MPENSPSDTSSPAPTSSLPTAEQLGALGGARLEPGSVALIGGGPGALDLITVRGLSLLRQADVVVVDRLGPVGLVELLGEDVEVIGVGKSPGKPSMRQGEIEQVLVEQARAGHRVARLKGGDPFLLGRGGEEVLACRAAGIPVQVVPGVTSALAGPAAGDVPVTHRGVAVATHVVNAHGDLGPADLAALADPGTTTVLMMGVGWLPRIVSRALLNGIDPELPMAVVQEATLPGQRVVRGTLSTIEQVVAEAGIGHPAVIVAGQTTADGFLEPEDPEAAPHPRGSGREALPSNRYPATQQEERPEVAGPVLIGCAHGTRGRAGRDVVRDLLMRVRILLPQVEVREAYVDVQAPEVSQVVREWADPVGDLARTGPEEHLQAVVVPLLLSTGMHVGEDIAEAVAGHRAESAGPLGPDPRLATVMAERLTEAGATAEDAVVMAVAGTRDAAGQAMGHEMGSLLAAELGREVTVAFVSAAQPDVPSSVAALRERGAERVAVASYLLAPGYFGDMLAHAGADLIAEPLGDHPLVAEVVVDRFRSVTGA